jgi:chalcone isomerase-like protein
MLHKRILPLLLTLAAVAASGAEVAGVKIDERTKVGASELALNGAGLRKRFFLQVYAVGLYVADRKADPISQPGAKRVAIHMLRDVGAEQFSQALADGIRENHAEAEARVLEPRVKELVATMAEIKEAKKGMSIALDWTGAATQLMIDGRPAGRPIPGEDFYRALLRIWLGPRPVQDDLKKALLGG